MGVAHRAIMVLSAGQHDPGKQTNEGSMNEYRVSVFSKGGAVVSHSEWMGEMESDSLLRVLQRKHGEAAVELAGRKLMLSGKYTYETLVHASTRFE
jgi:hypothetical protein